MPVKVERFARFTSLATENDGTKISGFTIDDEHVGYLYKEPDMTEWAANGDLEARFGENCVAGAKTFDEAKHMIMAELTF